jgi:uncharacterized protein (TIGR03118 family)
MQQRHSRRWLVGLATALLALIAVGAFGAAAPRASEEAGNVYVVHNLVSDQPGVADVQDTHLVNGWGLTRLPTSPWWVADNGTDLSTLYNGAGAPLPLVVSVPNGPTGTVANGGSGFVVHSGAASGPARFLFDNEAGEIYGWSPTVPAAGSTTATLAKTVPGAIFKGLTMAGGRLYATDFHNGVVDVFDSSFTMVAVPGGFADPLIPGDFAPFGIQAIGNRIFVTYAKQDEDAEDEVAGLGQGFVDEFDLDGNLIGHLGIRGRLNAPWGVALAPDGFGKFSGDILVGNFGDGRIIAFEPFGACNLANGGFVNTGNRPCALGGGPLRGADGFPIVIDGLWGIGFGGGNANSGPATTLYFAAGPDDESHGLFGTVAAG